MEAVIPVFLQPPAFQRMVKTFWVLGDLAVPCKPSEQTANHKGGRGESERGNKIVLHMSYCR